MAEPLEVTEKLGKTIRRLRQAYNYSLGDLSEQSGVAKSIISQIAPVCFDLMRKRTVPSERFRTSNSISFGWRSSAESRASFWSNSA